MIHYSRLDVVDQQGVHDDEKGDLSSPSLKEIITEPRLLQRKWNRRAGLRSWLAYKTKDWSPIDSMNHTFNPSIEGLRSIAAGLTMICHVMNSHYFFREAAGSMGVTMFFVLSGFLITAILIRLRASSQTTFGHILRFYADRFFRLTPALFLVVVIIYPFQYWSGNDMAYVNRGVLLTLGYLSNNTSLRYRSNSSGPWPNTWSLACEEQYYIIWAMIIPFIIPRSITVKFIILTTLITTSIFIRLYSSMYPGEVLWKTEWHVALTPNVWKMLVGSSLRLLPSPPWLLKRQWSYLGLLGLVATLCLSLLPQPNYGWFAPGWTDYIRPILAWTDFLTAIFTTLLLCGLSGPRGGIAILEVPPLRLVGRISYSWYLWQVPLIVLNRSQDVHAKMGDTAMAMLIAMCSTIYLEEPINKTYKRWKLKRDDSSSSSHAPV